MLKSLLMKNNKNSQMIDVVREAIEDDGYIFISENIVVKKIPKQNLIKTKFYVTIIGNQYSIKKRFKKDKNE